MTPKEKALELCKKFIKYVYWTGESPIVADENAKQCALIAVDEILNNSSTEVFLEPNTYDATVICIYDYWQQVKEEINNL